MKYKYIAWIPSWSSIKVSVESDKKLTKEQAIALIEEKSEPEGDLCHYCSSGVEIDNTNLNWSDWDKTFTEKKERD